MCDGLGRPYLHTFPHLHTSFLLASAFFLLPLHLKPIKGSSGVREGKGKACAFKIPQKIKKEKELSMES